MGIGALLHFLVDGLCVCSLYLMVCPFDVSQFVSYFVLYNVLAFLTQPLTGYLVDRMEHKHWMLLSSILLLTLAVGLTTVSQRFSAPTSNIAISVLLGLGNSLFHVWGGQQVTVQTGNDIRSLGIFVSTGALGLAVGVVFFSWWMLYGFLLGVCLLSIMAIRTLPQTLLVRNGGVCSQSGDTGTGLFFVLVIVVMAVVALRAWLCEDVTADIGRTQTMVLLLGFTAMLGKAFGGFLCRWMGLLWSVILIVVGIVACYFLPHTSYLLPLVALFLINCTMPVTLWLANVLLPQREGLAFGLLAAALMPGYLLTDFTLITFLVPLVCTIIIELGVLYFLRERRTKVLWASVAINVITNLPLNWLVFSEWIMDLTTLLFAEFIIVIIETLWYFCFVRQWKQAFVYGILCNTISFLIGLLFILIYYIVII